MVLQPDADDALSPEQRALLTRLLEEDRLIIYPTDTLYALGGRALDPRVSDAVREAKGRPPEKALPVVAADLEQAAALCDVSGRAARALARRFWPGPLTLVLEAAAGLPPGLTAGSASLAVRVPARGLTRELCRLAGPLISTSANRSGGVAPATCAEAVATVGNAAAVAVDGGAGGGAPSTLVDLTAPAPKLLREGAVAWSEIAACLERPDTGGSGL